MAALYGAPSPANWSLSVGGDPLASTGSSVYVGNLAWEVTSEELNAHFSQAGMIVSAELPTGHNGRSRGYGIVVFETPNDANNAIATMNETEFKGRMMIVREDGGAGAGRGRAPPQGGAAIPNGGASVYVGGLTWDVTSEELNGHFSQAGMIVSADVRTGNDGQSRGYGIVVYETPNDAQNAIATMNETDFKGRTLIVREDRGSGGGRGGGGGGGGAPNSGRSASVYVGGLTWDVNSQELREYFSQAGRIVTADVRKGNDGQSRGYGIVVFETANEANNAIATMNETDFKGRNIVVREDRQGGRSSRRGGGGDPGATIYIGNLSPNTHWKAVKDMCKNFGDCRVEVFTARNNSSCYATAVFGSPNQAAAALDGLAGATLEGFELNAKWNEQ